jgi:signal transduction histidine kinase
MKILFVDDSPTVCAVYEKLLCDNGHKVVCVQSSKAAIEATRKESFALAIIDFFMPDGNGDELTRVLLADKETSKLLVVIHSERSDILKQALAAGAIDLIYKDDPPEIFIMRVASISRFVKLQFASEARDAAEAASLEKSRFIATMSHELRTPLTSIKGALSVIKGGVVNKDPEKLSSIVDLAYRNTERLCHLVDDILDIEKLNVGKMNFLMSSVNLSGLLEESVLSNEAFGNKYGVTYACSGIADPLLVHGDHYRLVQVMANLLSNAAKFSKPGGQVDASIVRHEGSIRVAISDKGCGIPIAAQATIFDNFTQVDSSDLRQSGGSGLGLGIAKMIVEAHDGCIAFTSEEGYGSVFYFDLPEVLVNEP